MFFTSLFSLLAGAIQGWADSKLQLRKQGCSSHGWLCWEHGNIWGKKERKKEKKKFFICSFPSIPLFLLQYIYGRTWGLGPAQLSTVCWKRSSVSSSTLAISCKLTTGCWGLIQLSVDHFDIGGGCGLISRLKMAADSSMWQICVLRGKNLWPHVRSRFQRSNQEDKLVLLC